MGRAPCCDKANVKKGPWSLEEDAKLKAYIEKYGIGGNWIALPQKIGLKRCGKSCRLRWLNYLRPNLKHGGFTEEEDDTICQLYISIGSRWSVIAAQLPGRTDNDIKNNWNTKLKKKLLGRRKQSDRENLEENAHSLQNLSSSALERLQLHMHLQNPSFSFYSNKYIWPKMIETLNSLSDARNINNLITNQIIPMTEDSSGFSPIQLDDIITIKNDTPSEVFPAEVNGSKENDFAWWASDGLFDQKSDDILYQDYDIGYAMQSE